MTNTLGNQAQGISVFLHYRLTEKFFFLPILAQTKI